MAKTRGKAAQHAQSPDLEDSNDASPDDETGKFSFEISFNSNQIPCELQGGNEGDKPSLIFTHGAGGGISNPATQDFAAGFAESAPVMLFQGTMNIQNRIRAYETVMEHADFSEALGGRSMGARAAGTIAAENEETKEVVLVSYPLIGKGGDLRDEILLNLPERVDVLFIIGSEDNMCPPDQFDEVREKMTARSWLVVVRDADHGMSVKPKAGTVPMRRKTGALAAAWLKDRDADLRFCSLHWDSEKGEAVAEAWEESGRLGQTDEGGGEETQPKAKKRKLN